MKGFKDSTRTKYACGGRVAGPRGAAAVSKAMSGMKGVQKKQDGGAIGRANRMQALEAREEERLLREVPARPTRGNRPNYTQDPEATPRRTPTPTPTPTRAPRRGPAGAGFAASPMVDRPLQTARRVAQEVGAPKMLQKGLGFLDEATTPRRRPR